MIRKRGNFSSVRDLVCSNTGMTEEELLDDRKSYRIDGLDEAAGMLKEAMASGKSVCIFGDYDVDGICASSIIKIGMESLGYGGRTIVRLPKRFSEGYGVTEKALDEFEDGQLLVTVDNGIAAAGPIRKAREKGMRTVVIDHHLPPSDDDGNAELPEADLIIDPKALPGSADFDGYCGAGLAYRLMCRLVDGAAARWKMLCLAAVATIADVMPLVEENRRIVKQGLAAMTDMRKATKGLYSLLLACGCAEYVNEETVSFKIAPCLNAPGRLLDDGAKESFRLLTYDGSLAEAKGMAEKQLEWNAERKALSDEWTGKAAELADADIAAGRKPVVLRLDGIPEGIAGIVAGRIAERVKCPCAVLAQAHDMPGMLKGSARSYGGADLYGLLREGAGFLEKFGGHREAAGLTLKEESLDAFRSCMHAAYGAYAQEDEDGNDILYDLEADGSDGAGLRRLLDDVQKFAPYGQGNPQPVIFIRGLLLQPVNGSYYRYMGTSRSAVRMQAKELDCVAFNDAEQFERIGAPAVVDIAGTACVNHYMGKSKHRLEFSYVAKSLKAQKKSALAELLAKKAGERNAART